VQDLLVHIYVKGSLMKVMKLFVSTISLPDQKEMLFIF